MKADTRSDEVKHSMLRLAEMDLHLSARLLEAAPGLTGIVLDAVHRDAVISYARSFHRSQWNDRTGTVGAWRTLRIEMLPPELHDDHKFVMAARDQLIAHTDHSVVRPELLPTAGGPFGVRYAMGVDVLMPEDLEVLSDKLARLLPAIHRKVREVLNTEFEADSPIGKVRGIP